MTTGREGSWLTGRTEWECGAASVIKRSESTALQRQHTQTWEEELALQSDSETQLSSKNQALAPTTHDVRGGSWQESIISQTSWCTNPAPQVVVPCPPYGTHALQLFPLPLLEGESTLAGRQVPAPPVAADPPTASYSLPFSDLGIGVKGSRAQRRCVCVPGASSLLRTYI